MTKEFLQLRNEINKIDNQIVLLLKKRFKIIERIKKYKLARGLSPEDKQRESEILNSKINKSEGLSKNFIQDLFRLIFQESKRIQGKE